MILMASYLVEGCLICSVNVVVFALILSNTSSDCVQEHVNLVGWCLGLNVCLDGRQHNVSEGISVDLSQ